MDLTNTPSTTQKILSVVLSSFITAVMSLPIAVYLLYGFNVIDPPCMGGNPSNYQYFIETTYAAWEREHKQFLFWTPIVSFFILWFSWFIVHRYILRKSFINNVVLSFIIIVVLITVFFFFGTSLLSVDICV